MVNIEGSELKVCLFRTPDNSGIRVQVWHLYASGGSRLAFDADYSWQMLHGLIHDEERAAGPLIQEEIEAIKALQDRGC